MSGRNKQTRGKTQRGRLRALDRWMCRALRETLVDASKPTRFVDLGFGEYPWTLMESAQALRAMRPDASVIGVELDPERASRAQEMVPEDVEIRCGGFEIVHDLAPITILRAMNLLRQYHPSKIDKILQSLTESLGEGGWLLEGSCDRSGDRMVLRVFERHQHEVQRRGLLFYTSFAFGFAPWMFRDYLPQGSRADLGEEGRLGAFLRRWHDAWESYRAGLQPRDAFVVSARALQDAGDQVELSMVEEGYLWWVSG